MSISDYLSPADRINYAEEYNKLATLRNECVKRGDQIGAKRYRQRISALSSFYQRRTKKYLQQITGVWIDECSDFSSEQWDKIKSMDFGNAEARVAAHMHQPRFGTGGFVTSISAPRREDKSYAMQQIAAYREIFKKFFTPQPKEQTMIKVFNSSDNPEYHTDDRAGINLTHLLSKDQMLEIAKMAYKAYGAEMLDAIGMKRTTYNAQRARTQIRRAFSEWPDMAKETVEQHGYRPIQPYTLEVAMRQVADAQKYYPHHFGHSEYINVIQSNHYIRDVYTSKDEALRVADRHAEGTGKTVHTYGLVSVSKIEEVATIARKVVRRPQGVSHGN